MLNKLVGLVIDCVEGLHKTSKEVIIKTRCGLSVTFYHEQDCCEKVHLEDYEIGLGDLKGALVTHAEVVTEKDINHEDLDYGSMTYTFYKIETNKGELFMRWFGGSNGYYSEEVSVSYGQLIKP